MITNLYLIERIAAFRRADDLRHAEQRRRVRLARQYRSEQCDQAAACHQRTRFRHVVAQLVHRLAAASSTR
jgi:hypothetical protein